MVLMMVFILLNSLLLYMFVKSSIIWDLFVMIILFIQGLVCNYEIKKIYLILQAVKP